ncbi:DNA-binding protein [Trinickia dabaoshanensis]|uniref:DNA-binding protein n=1 Tax=Trinickia dabaoshanensis TaxID=564714 RepID=A0A2N7VFS0_9BURK|nr:DNA-binding protein [Trinickia dabaoshanensis]PMS15998.1 DNA-binding protein [Trinickia dabaoshanensis]
MTLDEQREAIRNELESLRNTGAHRRELSLHACKRLFFDLGIRPSAAAVRELTQTGSASDIPKDIDHFWERIRDASRVRIGAGAIPRGLEEKAGELLGALFEHALTEAKLTLEDERKQLVDALAQAQSTEREAQIRQQLANEAVQRSEARAQEALERAQMLEAQVSASMAKRTSSEDALQATVVRLETERARLEQQLETERAANAALRERIDSLHQELRQSTEHYATQIKDAISEAERRVKPMLVELDSLRTMAATYQAGIRDASRKEFDFIQQLSAAKGRGDRLEAQVREQSDEIDALTRELAASQERGAFSPELAALLRGWAETGRLDDADFAALGTTADALAQIPAHCPKCVDGEPELARADDGFELLCPECDHSSGIKRSRLEAVTRFMLAARIDDSNINA